jgi:hypothetical protein
LFLLQCGHVKALHIFTVGKIESNIPSPLFQLVDFNQLLDLCVDGLALSLAIECLIKLAIALNLLRQRLPGRQFVFIDKFLTSVLRQPPCAFPWPAFWLFCYRPGQS